jgi:hypothetical protein
MADYSPQESNPDPIQRGRSDDCAKLKASDGMEPGLYDNGLKSALYAIIPNYKAEVQNGQKKTPN